MYLHHTTQEEMHMDGTATCGSTAWSWITTSWDKVTCPHCLEHKVFESIVRNQQAIQTVLDAEKAKAAE